MSGRRIKGIKGATAIGWINPIIRGLVGYYVDRQAVQIVAIHGAIDQRTPEEGTIVFKFNLTLINVDRRTRAALNICVMKAPLTGA